MAETTSGHHLIKKITGHFTSPHLNDVLGQFGPLSSLSLSKTQGLSVIKIPTLGCGEAISMPTISMTEDVESDQQIWAFFGSYQLDSGGVMA